jgi:two-component system, NarL family, nitrate/nitrite response regulator NarL
MSVILVDRDLLPGDALCIALRVHGYECELVQLPARKLQDLSYSQNEISLVLIKLSKEPIDYSGVVTHALRVWPLSKIVLISNNLSTFEIAQALNAGASGYVSMHRGVKSLVAAMGFVLAGETYSPPADVQQNNISRSDLTSRERRAAFGLIKGLSNKEIAFDMGLVEATVKLHVKTLMRKLSAKNRAHAAGIALLSGLLSDDENEEVCSSLLELAARKKKAESHKIKTSLARGPQSASEALEATQRPAERQRGPRGHPEARRAPVRP